ncbi:hypothetical protein E1B28_004686 [Marasmius oreades]|uniref:Uncharacterized protein n=1 Tax=Marasmius oreades TaxID=181124 RepID=A0A9P7UZ62_9AGAR|nr:uncharacterized protein E1B28_004686 [Marasmius oreades]KAG7097327.1 hypothetical protein E1B28_004686 [Marasmius oreades]
MGKWTLDYYDEVLNAKFKSLVSGAITRSALEKGEPKISYERFVDELDTGDSFTTSVIDCLVKEVADRSSRPKSERNAVAQQTTRSLRQIISASRLGSSRGSGRHNRIFGLSDFLTSDADNNSSGDELAQLDSAEGARVNSELFDAYDAGTSNMSFPFLRRSSPDPIPNQRGSPSHGTTPVIPTSSSPRTLRGVSLSRQPSIRRLRRSRVVDFNEYTSHRRNSYRDTLLGRLEQEGSPTSEGTPDLMPIPTRRFFPATHREESPESDESRLSVILGINPTLLVPSSSRQRDTETSDERATQLIRLGVFPTPTPGSGSPSRSPPVETSETIRPFTPSLPSVDHENDVPLSAAEGVAAYPTPRTVPDEII